MTRSTRSPAATSRISPGCPRRGSESKAAAVAQAGHDVLIGITPAANTAVRTRIADMLTASLALIDDGAAETSGRARRPADAAAVMIAARAGDGRADVEPFVAERRRSGKWRPVAPLNANVQGQFATVTPLTLKSTGQFRTEGA